MAGDSFAAYKAWEDAGGPIWAWNRDGVLVLTTVREFWEQFYEDHPEIEEEYRKAFNEI